MLFRLLALTAALWAIDAYWFDGYYYAAAVQLGGYWGQKFNLAVADWLNSLGR